MSFYMDRIREFFEYLAQLIDDRHGRRSQFGSAAGKQQVGANLHFQPVAPAPNDHPFSGQGLANGSLHLIGNALQGFAKIRSRGG